jgi:hypothetical protein
MSFARLLKFFTVCLFAAMAPFPGEAATFSITSGDFGPSSIPELPSLTEMVTRACVQLRRERKGIGGGTFGVLDRRGIPESANV